VCDGQCVFRSMRISTSDVVSLPFQRFRFRLQGSSPSFPSISRRRDLLPLSLPHCAHHIEVTMCITHQPLLTFSNTPRPSLLSPLHLPSIFSSFLSDMMQCHKTQYIYLFATVVSIQSSSQNNRYPKKMRVMVKCRYIQSPSSMPRRRR
jgi:hypothetical protein